jgi:hypothetical protein
MVKSKLICLGCSLTAWAGLKEKTAQLSNLNLVNLSESAGSNILQVHRLHEYILDNEISGDDIMLWQITGDVRNGLRLQASRNNVEKVKQIQLTQFTPISRYHYVDRSVNIFDREPRLDILCHSPILHEPTSIDLFDANQQTQTLLATIILLHKIHSRLLVFFGWDGVLVNNNKQIFLSFLNKHSIPYIEQSYVNWVRQNNGEFHDNLHPTQESGELFAQHMIVKKFNELGWVK